MKSPELLIKCPLCGTPGFTARGLRQHCCAKQPGPKRTNPLPKFLWQQIVDEARRNAAQVELARDYRVNVKTTGSANYARIMGQGITASSTHSPMAAIQTAAVKLIEQKRLGDVVPTYRCVETSQHKDVWSVSFKLRKSKA